MRKRRGRSETTETQIEEEGGVANIGKEGKGFFACYLLLSLSPRHKGHTYIGFTVNPRRRIRQHNGEIASGAYRTKKKRPWEMVLCIYGFPTNVSALQFEWAWQHPHESLAVRKAAANFKSLSGIANKVKLAYTMLTLPAWQSLNITVNFFSTKYTTHSAGCPSLPEHMKVQVCSMDELPCYTEIDESLSENEDDWANKEECDEGRSSSEFVEETVADSKARSSADYEDSVDTTTDSLYNGIKELGEDCSQPSSFVKSLMSTSSSIVTSSFSVKDIAEDRDMINDCSVELHQPPRNVFTTVINNQLPSSSCMVVPHQVEIIDVSTPSPDCRTSLYEKKRRISTVRPEIIDLTKSPNFVQL
ncbi:hypothetical protein SO802_018518 [Lithocarpus litseifolius]|uniref:Structure-specific endonuclease subunit SLX1 homolog n=1 Tax=Lithocarpus litseifolius TaxID=425828 RepID=A0AAW2CL16_9ROSI